MSHNLFKGSFDKLLYSYPNNQIQSNSIIEEIVEDIKIQSDQNEISNRNLDYFCDENCGKKFFEFLNQKSNDPKVANLQSLLLNAYNLGYSNSVTNNQNNYNKI
jgi:hypothetical protein